MAIDLAYEAEIKLSFNYRKTQLIEIEQARIAYVMIEHKYESVNVLPIVYIAVSLSSDVYTKVIKSFETSRFNLTIRKRNGLMGTSIMSTVVNDEFYYIPSSTSPNYAYEINQNADSSDTSYRSITIGLISTSILNSSRKSFGGIYNNTNQENMINIALDGIKKVIKEDLVTNTEYKTLLIPPLASRYKLLSFLFDRNNFYNTAFTFYMDFNKTAYLLSKEGKAVDGQDGRPNDVIINILGIDDSNSFLDSFTIVNGAYKINVSSADTNVVINTGVEKVSNQLISYNDDTEQSESYDLNINNSTDTESLKSFIRSRSPEVIKSELETNAVMVELIKKNLDTSIFTPNKAYRINHVTEYSKYNGNYILSYKKEFYKLSEGTNGRFIVTCPAGFKRVSNPTNEYISNNGGIISKSGVTFKRSTSRKTTSEKKK